MGRPMTLGEMIATLGRKDPALTVRFDFVHFKPNGTIHSYRGYYEQLAVGYFDDGEDVTVQAFLDLLKGALGRTFTGYKGGDYRMDSGTPVWVAKHDEAGGTAIVDIRDDSWCVRLITANVD